jgi:teichuronic acid exporter
MALRKKMAHGMLWVLLEKGGQQGMLFITFAILARLIGPEEFGLYSLCYAVISLWILVISCLGDGVISKRTEEHKDLCTVFWTVLGIGLFLSVVTIASAYPFAVVMKDERLVRMMLLLSIIPFLSAVSVVPSALVQARMDFRIFTIRSLTATFISGAAGIYMAYHGAGAYSMIWQQILQQLIVNAIIWPSAGWRPGKSFHPDRVPEMMKPGFSIMWSQMINFLEVYGPRLIVGFSIGPVAVGIYSFALRLWQSLREVVLIPVSTAFFPALSTINHDNAEMRRLLKQMLFLVGFTLFPLMAGIIALAPQFVPLLFGPKWGDAVFILQLMFVRAIPMPFFTILRDYLRAINRTDQLLVFQITTLILTLGVVIWQAPAGLIPMSMGLIAVSFLSLPIMIWTVSRTAGTGLWEDLLQLFPSLFASALAAAAVMGLDHYSLHPADPWLHLLYSAVIGLVVYAVAGIGLQYRAIKELAAKLPKLLRRKE